MTKFVPKEVLGDSTFVAVYDPESGDTGYVRMGDLVDKSETTVTAVTSPGGGISFSAGDRPLVGIRERKNSLLKHEPTRIVSTHSLDGSTTHTSVITPGDSTATLESKNICPVTGQRLMRLHTGTANNIISVRWQNMLSVQPAPDDVWILPIWFSDAETGAPSITLRLFTADGETDDNMRSLTIPGDRQPGWNFIVIGHGNEIVVGATTYGLANANTLLQSWSVGANITQTSTYVTIVVEAGNQVDLTMLLGSIFLAPAGWCTGSLIFQADDVPLSFWEHAVPEFEARNLPYSLAPIARNFTSETGTRMDVSVLREAQRRGAEIIAHSYSHQNFRTVSESGARLDLMRCRQAFAANGFEGALHGFAYPFNARSSASDAMLKEYGWKFARATGGFGCSWQPTHRLYNLPSFSVEVSNSWHVDACIQRCADMGLAGIAYGHDTIPGGEGVNTRPATSQHYHAHLVRWLDRCVALRDAGKLEVHTYESYFAAVGMDWSAVEQWQLIP